MLAPKRKTLAALAGIMMLSACASYKPSSPVIRKTEQLELKGGGPFKAAARVMKAKEEQQAYFDADFTKAGVIAIEVVTRNDSDKVMQVRPVDLRLELPDGLVLRPASVSTTVATVGERGSVVGAAIAFGLIGAMVAQGSKDEAQAARRADYEAKSFPDTDLMPGGAKQGFVFYIPPKNIPQVDTAMLAVQFSDRITGAAETVHLPLTSVGYTLPKSEE